VQDPHFTLPNDTDRIGRDRGQVEADLQQLKATVAELEPRALRYDRLLSDLRCDEGPRALRMVLPLARMFRALGGAPPREPVAQARPPTTKSFFGSVRSTCAAGVRTVLRPITRRIRGYLHEPILPINQKLDSIARELESLRRRPGPEEPRNEKGTDAVSLSPELLRSIEALLLTIAARTPRDERE
jgi:hypothetical protein